MLRKLIGLRRLRGTALDPFSRSRCRRLERKLIGWYAEVLENLAGALRTDNLASAIEIAALLEQIRGYEDIKLQRADRIRPRVDSKLSEFLKS